MVILKATRACTGTDEPVSGFHATRSRLVSYVSPLYHRVFSIIVCVCVCVCVCVWRD